MKKTIFISVITLFMISFSCQKEKKPSVNLMNIKLENSNKKMFISNSPKNVDGILRFDSEEHLKSFYLSLDEILESGQDKNLNTDSLLKEVEDGLNFLSFRQDFINKYDWEGREFEKEEIDELYKADFIIDDVRKSILNEHLEVGIGDFVYVFFSENKVYKIPNSKLNTLLEFRDLKKGNDYEISTDVLVPGIELISSNSSYGYPLKATADDTYYGYIGHDNVPCDVFRKNILIEFYREFDTTRFHADGSSTTEHKTRQYSAMTINVDFGDNSPTETQNNTKEFWVSHTYTATGSYTVTATYTYRNVFSGATEFTTRTREIIVDGACSPDNVHSYGSQNDGSWELAYKVWSKQDAFGKHLAAYSHSWKKNNRGKWKRTKANLFCRVEGVYRNNNCSADENLAKSKTTHGKKLSSKKHRNKRYKDVQNGDCKSSHSFGGGSWHAELVLNPC